MKKNKMRRSGLIVAMTLCMGLSSVTAFATEVEEPSTEDATITSSDVYALTPEGNLTLVDDVETNSIEDKQFITMQSKNGNYFYLVIDRSGNTENVYFLNLVDEADLLALIEDAPQVDISPSVDTTVTTDPTESGTTTTIPESEGEVEVVNTAMLALIGILGLGGGGTFYYLKFVKPKKNESKPTMNLEDYEFDEDELEEEEEYGFAFDDATEEELEEELDD